MVAFCPCQIPTIFLQHLQNIFDFVFFHIIECFDHVGKGMNNNTSKQSNYSAVVRMVCYGLVSLWNFLENHLK